MKETSSNEDIKSVKRTTTEEKKQNADNKTFSTKNSSLKHKMYISYPVRLFTNLGLFLLFFATSLIFATKTLEREKLDPVRYSQKGDVAYKVYLNKNDYYTQDYLDMNKVYIANLINHISIDYNYLFSVERETKMNFDYKIIGELVIENTSASNRFFEKEYVILDSKKKEINNGRDLNIYETIDIDYDKYNNLANSFKSDYGIETNSYLNVYMEVSAKTDETLNYKINENDRISLKIPLSEKAIEISLNKSNQDYTKQVLPTGSVIFNVVFLIAEIIFFIITVVFFSKTVKYFSLLMKRQNDYDKYVNKLLRDYDRLIVETHNMPNISDCNVIEVKDFMELLDVRDNLKIPIMYYNITAHQKGIFYVKNGNDVYTITIKNVDLVKKK